MRKFSVLLVLIFTVCLPLQTRADNMAGYSTVLRVEFVLECMHEHRGSQYELMNKCSCVLDQLGQRYTAEDFVEARTTSQAITIAGERGSALRDNAAAHKLAGAYRESVVEAEVDCFLRSPELEPQE